MIHTAAIGISCIKHFRIWRTTFAFDRIAVAGFSNVREPLESFNGPFFDARYTQEELLTSCTRQGLGG